MWISIEDRCPNDDQYVWCYFDQVIFHGQYDAEKNCFHLSQGFSCGDVTHWMEAPDPMILNSDEITLKPEPPKIT